MVSDEHRCLVCQSQYREHYEDLYDRTGSLSKVVLESKEKRDNNGLGISKATFNTHFQWRKRKIRESMPATVKQAVRERIREAISILDELTENLNALRQLSERLYDEIKIGSRDTPHLVNSYTKLLGEIRHTLTAIRETSKSLHIDTGVDEEQIANAIRDTLYDIDIEVVEKIRARLKEKLGV